MTQTEFLHLLGLKDTQITVDGIRYDTDFRTGENGIYLVSLPDKMGSSLFISCDAFEYASVDDYRIIIWATFTAKSCAEQVVIAMFTKTISCMDINFQLSLLEDGE